MTERRLRLYACACSREAGVHAADASLLDSVRIAEAHADGLVSSAELAYVHGLLVQGWAFAATAADVGTAVRGAEWWTHDPCDDVRVALRRCMEPTAIPLPSSELIRSLALDAYEQRRRECPFCGPSAEPVPCSFCCGSLVYERGILDSVRMNVLADALEDAGCAVPHLREPVHARGCGVLDAILGR